jgi:regulator of PEP synthase PpsR (kinase-PPPase family)
MTAPPTIYIISDSVGDSAAQMAAAAASQFSDGENIIQRLPNASSINQIADFIQAHLEQMDEEIVVFYTIADPQLREQLHNYVEDKPVQAVDLIGPAISAIAEATGLKPKGKPGLIRKTDEDYYHRIEAMEYTVNHDDGRNPEDLEEADIVLIGVSRTSKTPLSIYLASRGYKVANVPLAHGTAVPPQLYDIDSQRVFGLTSKAETLSSIRYKRLGAAAEYASSYANIDSVQEDLDEARMLMLRLGAIIIKTDNRAIEETAQEVLRHYELSFPRNAVPDSDTI